MPLDCNIRTIIIHVGLQSSLSSVIFIGGSTSPKIKGDKKEKTLKKKTH